MEEIVKTFNNTLEIWKSVHGFDKTYQVSNFGNVRNMRIYDKPLLKQYDSPSGKVFVQMKLNYKNYRRFVGYLVAEAFLGVNYYDIAKVSYKDSNVRNNSVDNLVVERKATTVDMTDSIVEKVIRYTAVVKKEGRTKHLGYFMTQAEAYNAVENEKLMFEHLVSDGRKDEAMLKYL